MKEEIFRWVLRIVAVIVAVVFLFRFQIFMKSVTAMQENLGLLFIGKILYIMGVSK